MVHHLTGLSNQHVMVIYDHEFKTVIVQCNRTGANRYFAEFTDMLELYNKFEEFFDEHTDYETALTIFQPNIEA